MRKFYQERINRLPPSFVDTINSIMGIITDIDDVGKVIMFGSCSRGTQSDDSDIDLLLLLNSEASGVSFGKLEEKVGISIYEQFDSNYKKPVDLLFAEENVFINSTRPDSVFEFPQKQKDNERVSLEIKGLRVCKGMKSP
jgi:predicted nucleotidyltransferase